MDIRCPQCDTLYEFDEERLQSGSATLKCRKCQHMFRLGEDSQPSREDEKRWMVRDPRSGDVLYCSGFDKLHHWIVDRKVDRRWEISRTGDKWKTLSEIGEFRPIFQAVDNVSNVEGEETVKETESASDTEGGRSKKNTLDQFDSASDSGEAEAESSRTGSGAGMQARGEQKPERGDATGAASEEPTRRSEPDEGRQQRDSSSAEQPDESREREPSGERARSPHSTSAESSTAETDGSQDARTPQSQSGPEVQVDTGQFGGAGETDSEPDDDWAFDDEPDLDEEVEFGGGGPGGGAIAGLLAVLLLAAGGYMFAFERDRLNRWLGGALDDRTVQLGDTGESADVSGEQRDKTELALDRPREQVASAVGRAGEASGRKVAKRDGQAVAEASRERAGSAADEISEAGESSGRRSRTDLLQAADRAVQEGQSQRAQRLYQQILDREPSNSEALTGLGWTYLSQGQSSVATDKFQRALEINPNFGDAYIGLGHAYRNLGKQEKALEAYQNYLDKLPGGSKASIAEHQAKKLREALGR